MAKVRNGLTDLARLLYVDPTTGEITEVADSQNLSVLGGITVPTPTAVGEATNKQYVDDGLLLKANLAGGNTFSGTQNMGVIIPPIQVVNNTSAESFNNPLYSTSVMVAQVIQENISAISQVQFKIDITGTGVDGDLEAFIKATSAGAPTGADLFTSTSVSVSAISSGLMSFSFTGVTLTPNTEYAVGVRVAAEAGDLGTTWYVNVPYGTSPYAAGSGYNFTGAWNTFSGDDLTFTITDNGGTGSAIVSPSGLALTNLNLNMNSNYITNLPSPTASAHAATKGYVDGLVVSGSVSTNAVLAGSDDEKYLKASMTTDNSTDALSFGANKLLNSYSIIVGDSGNTLANKNYVDVQVQQAQEGIFPRASVKAASVVNQPLGIVVNRVVDGYIALVGERILLKAQTNPVENGIYVVQGDESLARSADMDNSPVFETKIGVRVFVRDGETHFNESWVIIGTDSNSDTNINVGTEPIVWALYEKTSSLVPVGALHIVPTAGNTEVRLRLFSSDAGLEAVADAGNGNAISLRAASIKNSHVDASAAIAYSKLSLSDSIVNADINSAAAIAYSKLSLSDSIVNADINSAAAIAYSKLALASSIVDADVSATAAIAYSKLSLASSIVDADVSGSAAIDFSKLASLTSANILVGNGSNVATSVAMSGDVTISNAGVTAIGSGVVTSGMLADSYITDSLTSANILVGNVSNVATSVAVTGDVTISNAGVTAIGASKVLDTMLASDVESTATTLVPGDAAKILKISMTTDNSTDALDFGGNKLLTSYSIVSGDSASTVTNKSYVDAQIASVGALVGLTKYTPANVAAQAVGVMVYLSDDEEVSVLSDLTQSHFVLGIVSAYDSGAGKVSVLANDKVIDSNLSAVLKSAVPVVAGDRVYWTGSALSGDMPTATDTRVWQVGVVAKAGATGKIHTEIQLIKVNS